MPMLPGDLPLQVFDPPTASAADWTALHRFVAASTVEIDPGGEPPTLAQLQGELLHPHPVDEPRAWVVRAAAGESIVARGQIETWNTDDNRHLAWFFIAVLPAWPPPGLARRLLAPIAGRGAGARAPPADRRAQRQRARRRRVPDPPGRQAGPGGAVSQLLLADLDRDPAAPLAGRGPRPRPWLHPRRVGGPLPR